MPQFDPAVWPPQIIWLAITFTILYVLMAKVALPRVAEVLEDREFRINESLRKAENLKRDAEDAVAAYEKLMADARSRAQEQVRSERERAAEEAAARHAELGRRLAAEVGAAEERIHAARAQALTGLRDVAQAVASAAVEKLTGQSVDTATIGAAVDAALAENRS